MIEPSQRMRSIPPYFFAQLARRIDELRASGHDVIRMDIGSPDLPPHPAIIRSLQQSAEDPGHHGYTPFGGTDEFKQAVRVHYARRFGVELDPRAEILGLIGSKEGIFHITQAFADRGDVVLVPDPGYPVYSTAAHFAGAEVVPMPLRAENGFLPALETLSADVLARTKILWLNYPNNPTGAVADLAFFGRVLDLAREYSFLVCHDAPYTELCFDGYVAPSLLQVEGSRELAVEFNSLSKSHNMAGWRVGMAVGNREALGALGTLKSQIDTSHFRAVFDAAATALTGDQSWLEERNHVYEQRRDLVIEALTSLQLKVDAPRASLYVWAPLPDGSRSSVQFCDRVLNEVHVSITPGVAFGAAGEGYMRFSLGSPTERVMEAMQRLKTWNHK